MAEITNEWSQYQRCLDYNRRIDLFATVDKNERFFAGDQWAGVVSNGLPTPVFNFIKRVVLHIIASILSSAVKMQFSPMGVAPDSEEPQDMAYKKAAEVVNEQCKILWENLKMDTVMRDALLDGAISGDFAAWIYFDTEVETGQQLTVETEQGMQAVPIMGEIALDLADNVNVLFGNPNDYRVEKQPYIIISFRELVANLKEEARYYMEKKENTLTDNDINSIATDTDYQEQSGDRAKIEMDSTDETDGKATVIIKLWREKGTKKILWSKCTKTVKIRDQVDYGITKYPVVWGNWDRRTNSYHGQAMITGLIPNQIFINKAFAMVMLNLMQTAFPKIIYNKTFFPDGWNNQIGEAVGSVTGEDMTKAAHMLNPPSMSGYVMNVIDAAINYTKDFMGASDAALGDVKPDNTSAIIAVQQAASIPLENIKAHLYQWVEDIGNVWYELMASMYGPRKVPRSVDGKTTMQMYDFSQLQQIKMKLKIDVGPSSYWSEIATVQTLDNLRKEQVLNVIQYLERMPEGFIPQKKELIDELNQQMTDGTFIDQILAQFAQSLPPEIQQQLAGMPQEEARQQLMQMMQPQQPAQQIGA